LKARVKKESSQLIVKVQRKYFHLKKKKFSIGNKIILTEKISLVLGLQGSFEEENNFS